MSCYNAILYSCICVGSYNAIAQVITVGGFSVCLINMPKSNVGESMGLLIPGSDPGRAHANFLSKYHINFFYLDLFFTLFENALEFLGPLKYLMLLIWDYIHFKKGFEFLHRAKRI